MSRSNDQAQLRTSRVAGWPSAAAHCYAASSGDSSSICFRPTTAVHVDTCAPSEGPLSGQSVCAVGWPELPEAVQKRRRSICLSFKSCRSGLYRAFSPCRQSETREIVVWRAGLNVFTQPRPEADKTPCSESREAEPDSPSDEQQASNSSERDAYGHHFLCENEQREANDPNQVHYASIEQEGH